MDADAVAIQSIQTQLENDKVHPVDRGPWALVGRALANVPFAAVFLAAGLVLPLALAGAMLLRGPPLDIDLSYAAFEVRNHKASRRFDALALALRSQIVMHISTLLPSRRHRHTRELQAENCSMGNADYGHDRVLTKTLKLSWPAWPCKVNNVEELIRQLNRYRARQERSTHHVRSKSRVFNSSEPSVKPYHSRLFEQIPLWAKNHGGPVRPGRFRRDTVSVQPPWQQVQPQWHMQLIFVARNGDTHHNAGDDDLNIFTPERLEVVRSVEHSVMAIPGFQEFCWRPKTVVSGWPGPKDSETPPCAPPTSLLSYLYPSEHDGKLWFDGLGSDLADVNGSLHLALTHPQTYWFVDAMLDVSNCLRSRLLRAELALGAPLPGFASTRDRPTLQRESVRSFMLGYAELLPTLSTNSVRVLYGGPDLFDNEVRETFRGDVRLAIVSATFIALLVFLLTHASLFLTVVGLGAIAVGCLLALFLYRVALSVRYLGILNGVAAFVVIGIGVDDVFVFVNAYQQTASLSSRAERLSTTLRSASRATFFTSATTAASYAANLGSQVPAVHDFGLFMAIVISCCWLFVSLLLPPALSLWSHFSEDWRLSCCRPPMRIETNPLDTSEASFPRDTGGYLDDDIPLLSASMEEDGEEECGNESPNGDVGLLHPVDEEKGKATGFVAWLSGLSWLQSALTRWMVLPAIKAKGKVLGIYMLILLLAAWAAFRLRLASHPPLLFRPETNIQSLLNLQDNLSSPAIACHTCSGLFLENPRPLHFPPAPWPPPEVPDPPDLQIPGLLRNVYISQFLGENIDEPVYRFSLDPMVPSPWQQLPPGRGNVPYFKAFARPWGNFSQRLTVCASRLGLPTGGCPAKFLLTDFSCDGRRGWSFNFSFFVALKPQLSSRRLFFAQARRFPFNSRVCLGPQGCMVAPTAKGPNRQAFYVPYAAGAVPRPPLSLRGYNPCSDGPGCGPPASRPLVDSGAIVFLVFGILGLNQSSTHENHVIGNNGRVVYDPSFDLHRELPHLCLLCKAFAANARLVVDGGAQCLPQGLSLSALPVLPSECHALPQPHLLPGQLSHAALGLQAGRVAWIAMAFKSTTPHGRPAFQALTDYLQWENFLKEQLTNLPPDSALRHGFHTCQHWKQVFIEVLGIQGSLQSLGLSMGTCFLAIMIFTSHPVLLLTVMSTILGVLAVMVLFLWLVGGEFGAVEAISLSIVIGSSVDYSLHLVECYIHSPVEVHMTPRAARAQCAANQICLPIFSSGLTTVASALPLLFCTIAPFACFGRALSIAAVASLAGALILGPAILAFIGPSNFKRDGWAISKALTIGLVTVMIGFGIKAALGWSSDDEPVAERTLGVLT